MRNASPQMPGQYDFYDFMDHLLALSDPERKEIAVWLERMKQATKEYDDAVALYGKATEIDRLHDFALALKNSADVTFAERETAVEEHEAKVKESYALDRREREHLEREQTEQTSRRRQEFSARESELRKREAAVAEREGIAEEALAQATEMKQTALLSQQESQELINGFKAVMAS